MNYYQHHIGDFNNATRHLSLVERAIYRDLLDMYYDTEKPIDASNLERLARRLQCATEDQTAALKYVLEEFFTLQDGAYINNRCEREIAEFHGKRKQASEAGKASAKKRAEKKQQGPNGGSSNAEQSNGDSSTDVEDQSNENSTNVEAALNENLTDEQPTINHKPLTINQEPVTNNYSGSSNTLEQDFPLPPIQFSQYQPEDHKRYSVLECVNVYPIHYDFIELGKQRNPELPEQDLISMFTNFGDFFSAKADSKNTPSLWLVKWFTWIQNNKDEVRRQREAKSQPQKPKSFSGAASRTQNEVSDWMSEIGSNDQPAMRDVHEVEGVKYA
ncbi:YdaU family protein [Acinetobacter variabilis]|uniref:YdaU family protein n=1 Tax=Acinetobacter variabilis TaxID=70346 RepID=UPI00267108E2|nr:YdaU family protein [Acinetobacter variabilis]WKT72001.1 YdaU family protein [Acinetobacter variabilis]